MIFAFLAAVVPHAELPPVVRAAPVSPPVIVAPPPLYVPAPPPVPPVVMVPAPPSELFAAGQAAAAEPGDRDRG